MKMYIKRKGKVLKAYNVYTREYNEEEREKTGYSGITTVRYSPIITQEEYFSYKEWVKGKRAGRITGEVEV